MKTFKILVSILLANTILKAFKQLALAHKTTDYLISTMKDEKDFKPIQEACKSVGMTKIEMLHLMQIISSKTEGVYDNDK
ncbi:hypothetical protein [Staphylococcus americanisciuri]|uniref:Phage protein n=1 Tax=Staphylococcus americanisciuri TaxID=2973940 RepID=A0ABT2F1P0_9STAP|nr:hypothetical protein [Staphylococcus americanisciuri]MCS4486369.1 hypothetical protein [Staphylococcus americanisciuri]